ncbi:MAG: bifunctional phosphoribosylaminoimidazolecarboxamide formyltransferase/IMP cyclohydrolase [Aquiluna sp.]
MSKIAIKRALISVSDKTGLIELAGALSKLSVEIVSTGSTAKTIAEAGIPVVQVSEVTGFPESLDGRVKTLHPSIHGGILADLRDPNHRQQLDELGIKPFELVVVNLYPFVKTVESGAEYEEAIEQIDIGGPAMVRASAKNHANVAIVVNPSRYDQLIAAAQAGGTDLELRKQLALEAFSHTANYDLAVSGWLGSQLGSDRLGLSFQKKADLRYGENSHQTAALFSDGTGSGLAGAEQLGGKEMSYNNFVDADAALRAAYDFAEPAVAIIKHANPCGIAIADPEAGDAIASAHLKAHETDSVSAFRGVIAANRPVTKLMAEQVSKVFTEVIVAPDYESGALEVLAGKKNLRILRLQSDYALPTRELRQISGGMLSQEPDKYANLNSAKWELVCGKKADAANMRDLEFAWRACRSVKSNAILLASGGAAVGIGMGQVNRLDSARLAVSRAGERASGSVAASDAFFPFADGLKVLIDAGIYAVVQPGGSMRDEEVIAAAKEAGITMYFTGERHFFH